MRTEANRIDIQTRLKEYFDHYLKDAEPKKWMLEETPYIPIEDSKGKDKTKSSKPKWR